jgi:acyl-CoA synthetase (AMP-forming)/AMP-acid ligase II
MATLVTALSTTSSSPAIIIPESNLHISYPSLKHHISTLQSQLAKLGVSPGSAVSISLINGLEFAISFLAVGAQGAIAAPLNPAYKQSEVEFYVDDVKAGLIIVPRGAVQREDEAVKAARKFGAAVAEIYWDGKLVQLELKEKGQKLRPGQKVVQAKSDDIAVPTVPMRNANSFSHALPIELLLIVACVAYEWNYRPAKRYYTILLWADD